MSQIIEYKSNILLPMLYIHLRQSLCLAEVQHVYLLPMCPFDAFVPLHANRKQSDHTVSPYS